MERWGGTEGARQDSDGEEGARGEKSRCGPGPFLLEVPCRWAANEDANNHGKRQSGRATGERKAVCGWMASAMEAAVELKERDG